MKQALLVIDVQNDYFPGGKLALSKPEQALAQINQLEDYFLALGQPIIYIQHIKETTKADFFGRGTVGAELHPRNLAFLWLADSDRGSPRADPTQSSNLVHLGFGAASCHGSGAVS